MTKWTLRDMDNRDDNEAPYEVTDTPGVLSNYVSGPVRDDLTSWADHDGLDTLVAAFKDEDLATAQRLGKSFGIYVQESADE